jgi:hypothetical protein
MIPRMRTAEVISLRPEASLRENNEIALTSEGAGENKKPANTMAIKNLRIPIPAPSTNPSRMPPERFQQRSGFGQCCLEIGRSQIPKPINRIGDDRPGFYSMGGGDSIKADGSR